MPTDQPQLIAINHDDYHAQHVGHLSDGRQFMLTTPFEPALGNRPGCEFVALYVFDAAGKLIEAVIESLGPRATLDREKARGIIDRLLQSLGDMNYDRIEVAPFVVERFGIEFGLIPRPPDEEGDSWAVEMQPGNYMAFFEPWDSGEYDT